ncbi:MAG: phosphoadenylyl-sulfate reductase [Zetaproteobacteria bacterium]|nr:phosphoadenylyl-sulfate reductase [Zetaproteobacteria bacterium]
MDLDRSLTKEQQAISLLQAAVAFDAGVAFACSFGAEDVVLIDLIAKHASEVRIITLDTGRLPQQSYDVMDACRKKYDLTIHLYFPQAQAVEAMVREQGVNLFYHDIASRKACCAVRKIEPLKRALAGSTAWITGVRREQAESRSKMEAVEDDAAFQMKKFNPLIEWSDADVWNYIRQHHVPYNALHDQFYPSIGCAPCTRAVSVGEDPRSGRWWWEQEDAVAECGLHMNPIKNAAGNYSI